MDWEDLDERERQAAEDRAFEENPYGTGGDPDAEYGYDYDAGSPATDIDYQPADNGMSDEFTGYDNTNLYADQFGNYDDAAEDQDDADDNAPDAEDAEEEENSWEEDWNGDEDEEDGGDQDKDDAENQLWDDGKVKPSNKKPKEPKKTGDPEKDAAREAKNQEKAKKKQAKREKQAQNANIDTFIQLWPLIGQAQRKSKTKRMQIGQLWAQAGRAIRNAIQGISVEGPATLKIMKAYYWVKEALGKPHGGAKGDFDAVFINDMIEIITSMGQTLTVTVILVVKAVFDQTWNETTTAIFLKRVLKQAIHAPEPKKVLKQLLPMVAEVLSGEDQAQRA